MRTAGAIRSIILLSESCCLGLDKAAKARRGRASVGLLERALKAVHRVLQQHGDGHGSNTTRHRRDVGGHLPDLVKLDVAHQPVAARPACVLWQHGPRLEGFPGLKPKPCILCLTLYTLTAHSESTATASTSDCGNRNLHSTGVSSTVRHEPTDTMQIPLSASPLVHIKRSCRLPGSRAPSQPNA